MIRHLGSEKEYTVPVTWNGSGRRHRARRRSRCRRTRTPARTRSSSTTRSRRRRRRRRSGSAGTFRVEAFRVPLLRARMQAVGAPLVDPTDVDIDVQVSYLAGGGAGGLPVTLRTQVDAKVGDVSPTTTTTRSPAATSRKGARTRATRPRASASSRSPIRTWTEPTAAARPRGRKRGTDLPLTLDAARRRARDDQGTSSASDQPRDLLAELEYRDPNGETLTARDARRAVAVAKIVLGIKPDSWAANKERLKFTVVALDLDRQAGRRRARAHRCVQARLLLASPAPDRRLLRVRARLRHDARRRPVQRRDRRAGPADLRDGAARHRQPHPARAGRRRRRPRRGDARRRVGRRRRRSVVRARPTTTASTCCPRRSATSRARPRASRCACRSRKRRCWSRVEREGVLDAFVTTVSRAEPVARRSDQGQLRAERVRLRVPGARAHRRRRADRAHRSRQAVVQDGPRRVARRLGRARARGQGDAGARASTRCATRRRVDDRRAPPRRQRAAERQRGRARGGRRRPARAPAEQLVEAARRDDGARAARKWRPSTAQMQVIGKRHFGRKALAPGGGGGRSTARELFDTLLAVERARAARRRRQRDRRDPAQRFADELPHRRGRVVGRGSLRHRRSVDPVDAGPDAAFRPAAAGARRRPLPRDVHGAQRERSGRSTSRSRARDGARRALPAQNARSLAPGEARELDWDVDGAAGATSARIGRSTPSSATRRRAHAARDALKVAQQVVPAVPERTYQATILQLDAAADDRRAAPGRCDSRAAAASTCRCRRSSPASCPACATIFARYPYSLLRAAGVDRDRPARHARAGTR